MLISSGQFTVTTAAGSATANTVDTRGLCHHIVVKPETETTVYDIEIVNPAGATIYERTSETGTLSELTSTPLRGIYTVSISNATADEDFIIQLIIQE